MKFNDISDRFPWVWAAAGALLFWAVLMVTIGAFSFAPLVAAMTSGAFLLLIALGQSLAMMTGAGNVDLSMPCVITLSAYVSLWVIGCAMGALFLVFLSTLMPVIGFTGGEAEILQGSLIIAVLVIGGLRLRHQMAAAD